MKFIMIGVIVAVCLIVTGVMCACIKVGSDYEKSLTKEGEFDAKRNNKR